ncbi:MAG: CYTH domain-containing protein [Gammaproteobacteria bacterium]
MAKEIEKKFLLRNADWRAAVQRSRQFIQGYLLGSEQASVRIRLEGEQAYINIKSATLGVSRDEYEYAIPLQDAREMLERLCEKPLIAKIRHEVMYASKKWEIDEFQQENAGLIVAEVELTSVDEPVIMPPWVGEEVSADTRYYNVCLVRQPYSTWDQ